MMAAYMASVRNMRNGSAIKEIVVSTPPDQNTVEQLLALQQALSQLEGKIQAGNIFLLKTRALFLSALPEVSTLYTSIVELIFGILGLAHGLCYYLCLFDLDSCRTLNHQYYEERVFFFFHFILFACHDVTSSDAHGACQHVRYRWKALGKEYADLVLHSLDLRIESYLNFKVALHGWPP